MAKAEIKQSVPVFVSSTYEDLIEYRDEVQRVLIRLEQIVKGMEYFGSSPKKPLDVCLESVRSSKVYIGIIGMRYGSIEEETQRSFTQLEYEEAIKNNIPILIYIIDDNHPIPPKFVDLDKKAELLSGFKKLLTKNHTVSYFTTPNDLGKKLASDLLDVLESIDHIEINYQKDVIANDDFNEVFKKFMFRPAKFNSQEGELTIKISNRDKYGNNLKIDVVKSLGLTIGDTVGVPVYVIDNDTSANLYPDIVNLYGEKEMGDWIENVLPNTIAKVKVRLEHFINKEIRSYDGGNILSEVSYSCLVLLEII